MNLIVCVKQVIDPEMPPAMFEIDSEAKRAKSPSRTSLVINDYDEVALEAAVRVKESHGGKVTVISLGDDSAIQTIRQCLAKGADEGILIKDSLFEEEDRSITAYALAAAIKKIGDFDLIFCGRQEADWDASQVGIGIAEVLGIPAISPVRKLEIRDRTVVIERIVDEGYEVIECPLPCLVAVDTELATPRYPTTKAVLEASRKRVPIWSAGDIEFDASKIMPEGKRTRLLKLFKPEFERECELISGESPEEMGTNLVLKLREAVPGLF